MPPLWKKQSTWLAAVGAAVLALSTFRAVTQSLIHDEAFTYLHFVAGPWRGIFQDYDANNHVLYSLLAKASVSVLGVSEVALRLPTLLALVLFLFALARQCRVFPGVTGVMAFAAIAANPMLLDYSAAARGYLLGLAFLLTGLLLARAGRHTLTGLCFGLAVAANLTLAVPAVAIALVLLRPIRRLLTAGFLGLSLATAILFWPLRHAPANPFYYGASTLADWAENFVRPLLLHNPARPGPFGTGLALQIATLLLLPALAWLLWRRRPLGRIVLLAVVILVAAHTLLQVLYPLDRTGLYFVPLLLLALFDSLPSRAAQALAALLILQNLTQLSTRHFAAWEYDAAVRPAMETLCAHSAPGSTARVWWIHQPALEFYRRTLCPAQLRPIEREPAFTLTGADFYVWSQSSGVAPPASGILFRGGGLVVAAAPPR